MKASPYGGSWQSPCPEVEYISFTRLANTLLILMALGLFVLAPMGLGEPLGRGIKALDALAILSGAKQTTIKPSKNQNAQRQNQQRGTFWPIVRHLMIEKAIQLYVKDHPQPEKQPEMRELRRGGYMSLAKKIVLKELNQQRKLEPLNTELKCKMHNA